MFKNQTHRNGDQRYREIFALWPMRLNEKEMIWLEWFTVGETFDNLSGHDQWKRFIATPGRKAEQ